MGKRYIGEHLQMLSKNKLLNKGQVQFLVGLFLFLGFFLIPTVSGASCGDNICNNGENSTSCAADCGSYICEAPIDCPYVSRANGTFVEYLQFINGGDGILVLDRNEDGIVNAEDLFGGRDLVNRDVDNAFEDLALLDSNGDGIVNSSDDNFTSLKIWRRNSTSLDLVPINNTNVTYINLAYQDFGAGDPSFWTVKGTFNSSEFPTSPLPRAVGVNFTINLYGNFVSGDFLVLDLDNNSITTDTCTQCSTPITINLESPANNTEESSDSTPSFTFNITDNSATVNCTLWINVSGTASPYANNVSVLNTTSTTLITNTSLSNDGYYWWIDCSDDSIAPVSSYMSVKRFITILISAILDVPQTSSGGGGNIDYVPPKERIHSFSKITPGEIFIIKDFDKEIGVKEIQIEVNNPTQNVRVRVTKYDSKPTEISIEKSGKVYKYLEINTENLEENLSKAVVKIQVEKTWFSSNNLNFEDVSISKFNEEIQEWEELTTKHSSSDSVYEYYETKIDSFSFFAVSAREPDLITAPEPEKSTESTKSTSWPQTLIIIILIILGIYFLKYRKNYK